MAEELLGVGFEIHGGGSDLVFPHHENEAAQTRAAPRRAAGADLDAQRDARGWTQREDVQVGRQHLRCSHEALDAYGRDALIMYFAGGHYRQPMEFDDERLAEAAARACARIREAAPAPGRRALARRGRAPSSERFFDALADDFNTPRGAGRGRSTGCARPTGRRAGRATPISREMLDGARRSRTCSTRPTPRRRPRCSSSRDARERGPRRAGLGRGRPPARGDPRPRLGVRDGPDGPELLPAARPPASRSRPRLPLEAPQAPSGRSQHGGWPHVNLPRGR